MSNRLNRPLTNALTRLNGCSVIYLDYNATAPLRPEVLPAMEAVLGTAGNPSSLHQAGQRARQRVDEARQAIRDLVGAPGSDVVLTASGTEADNLAIEGLVRRRRKQTGNNTVIFSSIEHPAVGAACERLASEGIEIRKVPVNAEGRLELAALEQALAPEVALVSVMLANNETGVLQPLDEVVAAAAEHGVPVHTDAVQAAGKIPISFSDLGVDALSLSAHKLGGPRGIGALVLRPGTAAEPLWQGGGQQGGLRSGSSSALLAVGLAAAARAALRDLEHVDAIAGMRDRLESSLCSLPQVCRIGAGSPRLPNTASVSFAGVPSHLLVDRLSEAGVLVSGGAACHADRVAASSVLLAMGVRPERAVEVVRLSIGFGTTPADIEAGVAAIGRAVTQMREA